MKHFVALCSVALLCLLPQITCAETHALLIALGDYQDKAFGKLPALTSGANGLAKVLIKNGVPAANVELLTHESKVKPTRNAIQDALKRLGERVKKDDVAWVVYYGHGHERQGVSYLSCYDTKPFAVNGSGTQGLSVREFLAPLAKLPASLLVIGFEACRAEVDSLNADAAIPKGVRQVDFNLIAPAGKLGPRQVAVFLSSSENTNSYIQSDGTLGVFGSSLIRGMEGGAADPTGTVRVRNLSAYLSKAASGLAEREYGVQQSPESLLFGEGVQDAVLFKGLQPQRGGETAVPTRIGKTPEERYAAEFQQAYELREVGKNEEALKHFKAAADLKPDNLHIQGLIGVQLYKMDRLLESEPYFLRASKVQNPNPASLLYLAMIREKQGKPDEAEMFYIKSCEIGKQWSYGSSSYGYGRFLFYTRNDYKKSEKLLRDAIKMEPEDLDYKLTLALVLVYQQVKNTTEIEKISNAVLKQNPRSAEAHYTLGLMYVRLKDDKAKAKQAFQKCLEYEKEHTRAMEELGWIAYDASDSKEMEKWARQVNALTPKDGNGYILLAYALYIQNDLDAARTAAKKAVELGAYNKDTEIFSLLSIKPDEKTTPKPDKKP